MEDYPSLVELIEANEREMEDCAFHFTPLQLVEYVNAPIRPKRLPRKLKKARKKDLVLSLLKFGWSQKQLKEFHTFSKTVIPVFKPFSI
ncbi:hypothetical protein [Sphingobacterium zeae]|uniref:hypothetical protein n=1 Tax=Sphingobacterium zeae TaxID=1776859 RepID=UPI003618928E